MQQRLFVTLILFSIICLSCKQKEINLHYAIEEGNIQKVQDLINKGADINAKIKTHHHSHMPALHKAIIYYNAAIINSLLKEGADVNAKSSSGDTPLHLAAMHNKEKLVTLLIQKAANVNTRNNYGETPLHYTPNNIIAKLFIDNGAKINVIDNKGDQPIHHAVKWKDPQFVALLLTKGADVNARTNAKSNYRKKLNGCTPLHFLFMSGKNAIPIARLLIKNGAHINARNDDGRTPLHLTGGFDKAAIAEFLIKHGAAINIQDNSGNTPLHYMSSKKVEVPTLLLRKGAKMLKNNKGETPLHFAVSRYNVQCVSLFIKHGADINARDDRGNTPLHDVAMSKPLYSADKDKPYKIAKLLITHGADVTIKNNEGKTSLEIAKEKKNEDILNLLTSIIIKK